jgi:hypothetical protein
MINLSSCLDVVRTIIAEERPLVVVPSGGIAADAVPEPVP